MDLESEYFNSTSENGRDFIEHLLRLNPNKRMSAEDCLHHPWMADEILTNHRRRSSQLNVKNLRSFMAKERWKVIFIIFPTKSFYITLIEHQIIFNLLNEEKYTKKHKQYI